MGTLLSTMFLGRRKMVIAVLLLVAIGLLSLMWGRWVEPRLLTVKPVSVFLEQWAGTEKKARFVLAADFHLSPGEEGRLKKIVDRIIELKPDFVVLGGDYCNGSTLEETMSIPEIVQGLVPLTRHMPVYVILGNHDETHKRAEFVKHFSQHDFIFMEDRTVEWGKDRGTELQFAGVKDSNLNDVGEKDIPNKQDESVPMILFSHTPDVVLVTPEHVDLILSGHTHGGQICLPGGKAIVSSAEKTGLEYVYGLKARGKTQVLVTRGLGTSVLKYRFCCPPELMFVELTGKKAK